MCSANKSALRCEKLNRPQTADRAHAARVLGNLKTLPLEVGFFFCVGSGSLVRKTSSKGNAMKVSQALLARRSIRAFRPDPVPVEVITSILERAARSPSGGNLQPWNVAVLAGARMADFREAIAKQTPGATQYNIYPSPLIEPYRARRYDNGMGLYDQMGIARDDKAARGAALARNFTFFEAPAAIFIYIDRSMGPPQWSDVGMFLQSVMLLCEEEGYQTCAQEAWAMYAGAVDAFVEPDEGLMLFCGLAIGKADWDAQVNGFVSERAPSSEWIKVL